MRSSTVVSGGLRYNRELLDLAPGGLRRPVGTEGFFDISMQIPVFNRNQGNVAAARAGVEKARLDIDRTKLALRSGLAEVYRDYNNALTRVGQYQQDVLPKAQRAYELYRNTFRRMASAYPQVLIAQRSLFQLQDDYVKALVTVWQRSVEIEGLLVGSDIEFSGTSVFVAPPVPGGDAGMAP